MKFRDGKSIFAARYGSLMKRFTPRMREIVKRGRRKYIRRMADEYIREQT